MYALQVHEPLDITVPDFPGLSKLLNHVTVIGPPVCLVILRVIALPPESVPLVLAILAHCKWRYGAVAVWSSWLYKGVEVLHPVLNFDSFTVRCIPIVPATLVPLLPLRTATIISLLPAIGGIVEAVAVGWKNDILNPIVFFAFFVFLHGFLDTLGRHVLGACECGSAQQG